MLEHQDIEEILQLLDAARVAEFALETDRFKIVLRRGAGGAWSQERFTAGLAAPAAPAAAQAPGAPPAAGEDMREIRAPLVGTFYRAPKPGAPPFVDIGTVVQPDTVVAIVETMKLMTSIHAGQAGRVADILVGDGEFVEQSQVLMRVVPAEA